MGQHPTPAARVGVEEVTDGIGDRLLTVTFAGTATGRDLDGLFRGRSRGRSVSRIDPLGELSAMTGYVPLARLAEAYRDPVASLAPVAIVGHCTAAALTVALADDLARHTKRESAVVLLDPMRPTAAGVVQTFMQRRRALGAEGAAEPGLEHVCAHAPERALRAMGHQLIGDGREFAVRAGLSDGEAAAFADELVSRYRAWLGFLLASMHAGLSEPTTKTYCVLSEDRELPAGLGRPTVRRVAVQADRLLMESEVLDLVLGLVEDSHA
jgi:hypothetical protein